MHRFTDSIRKALNCGDWYGALTTALILPDICGRLETPNEHSSTRYQRWFDQWIKESYTDEVCGVKHVFLRGSDCYALRCSLLHEGGDNIANQKAREILNDFIFVVPPPGSIFHKVQLGESTLALQVSIFCKDIAAAVDKWFEEVALSNDDIKLRMKGLVTIQISGPLGTAVRDKSQFAYQSIRK